MKVLKHAVVLYLHRLRGSTRHIEKSKSLLTWKWASSSSLQLCIDFKCMKEGCKKEIITDSICSTFSVTKDITNKINMTWTTNNYGWINIFSLLNVLQDISALEMNLALSEYAQSSMSYLQQHQPPGKTYFLDLFPLICLTSLPSAVKEENLACRPGK